MVWGASHGDVYPIRHSNSFFSVEMRIKRILKAFDTSQGHRDRLAVRGIQSSSQLYQAPWEKLRSGVYINRSLPFLPIRGTGVLPEKTLTASDW